VAINVGADGVDLATELLLRANSFGCTRLVALAAEAIESIVTHRTVGSIPPGTIGNCVRRSSCARNHARASNLRPDVLRLLVQNTT
jgi:hypothetical protein